MPGSYTVNDFIRKWHAVELKERSAAQEHFLDLCRLLGEPSPAAADPTGDFYCFERGATKTSGGDGWADVWKRGHFGWEYKGKRKNLDAAFGQLQQYALALESRRCSSSAISTSLSSGRTGPTRLAKGTTFGLRICASRARFKSSNGRCRTRRSCGRAKQGRI